MLGVFGVILVRSYGIGRGDVLCPRLKLEAGTDVDRVVGNDKWTADRQV